MKKFFIACAITACSVVVVMSFFMPWIKLDASATQVSRNLLSSAREKLGDSPWAGKVIEGLSEVTDSVSNIGNLRMEAGITGADIPRMANDESNKLALSFIEIFSSGAKDLGKKSFLVYLVPGAALLILWLGIFQSGSKLAAFVTFAISGVLAIGGFYKLVFMDLSNMFVKIEIGRGMWHTLFAYLGIFAASFFWLTGRSSGGSSGSGKGKGKK
jgi:hypothetical protein